MLRLFQGEVEEVRQQGAADLERARTAEGELEKVSVELKARWHQLDTMVQEVKELEGRTENAEEVAQMVDARATDAAAQANGALQRAQDVEEKAAVAERAAAEAVQRFRVSTDFAEEVAEGFTDAYIQGFRDGKEKAARVSGNASLNNLEPDVGDESEEPPGGRSAPTDA